MFLVVIAVLESNGVQIFDDVGRANLLSRTFASKLPRSDATDLPDRPFSVNHRSANGVHTEESARRTTHELVVG